MAFDPDCSDEPPTNRAALSQMGGSKTTQIYKEAAIDCPHESLTLYKHRYTHWNSSTGDPRLSQVGSFDVVLDSIQAGEITSGDLFVEYDFTFGAPQQQEFPAFATTFNTLKQPQYLDMAGVFTDAYRIIIMSKTSDQIKQGVNVGYTTPEQSYPYGVYQLGFDKAGTYSVQIQSTPCNVALPSDNFMVAQTTTGGLENEDVKIFGIQTDPIGQVTSWVESSTNFARSVFSFLVEVKKVSLGARWLINFWDAARRTVSGGGLVAGSAVATGLTISYLGYRPHLAIMPAPNSSSKSGLKEKCQSVRAASQECVDEPFDLSLEMDQLPTTTTTATAATPKGAASVTMAAAGSRNRQ